MTKSTHDYRGTVVDQERRQADPFRVRLTDLADQYPVGARIVHACGRQGTVALDEPPHVPGLFSGKPSAVCLAGEYFERPMVFATWENEHEFTWRVWVPVSKVRLGKAPAINRPGNKARIGGRR
ncbi:hypothetical protein ABZT17_26775 [Streptomyces sp. NPDC005648]|uniref:hypothetical protein n=1 Tax=Streptomyces sp. NPDC005648 TaxID=3157044 RepID=UPI0033A64239